VRKYTASSTFIIFSACKTKIIIYFEEKKNEEGNMCVCACSKKKKRVELREKENERTKSALIRVHTIIDSQEA
jgi:hypothetical protein